MYITLDILQKRGACQEALNFFAKHYPDGVDMLYAIEKGHLPEHFLHWGYEHLDPNEEELAAYWKKVQVENSQGVIESARVYNSSLIRTSHDVFDSCRVYNSRNIKDSGEIVQSEEVENSTQIAASMFVLDSNQVLQGKNITGCNERYNSSYIVNSDGVFYSDDVCDSSAIWNSGGISDCFFCADCKDLYKSLFCQGIKEKNFMLFNKTIDERHFEMIVKQYNRYKPKIEFLRNWDLFGQIPTVDFDYRKHLQNIEEKFWTWVKTLPGYDPKVMYSLTFDPRFL